MLAEPCHVSNVNWNNISVKHSSYAWTSSYSTQCCGWLSVDHPQQFCCFISFFYLFIEIFLILLCAVVVVVIGVVLLLAINKILRYNNQSISPLAFTLVWEKLQPSHVRLWRLCGCMCVCVWIHMLYIEYRVSLWGKNCQFELQRK